MNDKRSKLNLIISMTIFGTIGIFVKYVNMPSCIISMSRGLAGALFVFCFLTFTHKSIAWDDIKRNLPMIAVSGIAMGFNWICLFESYNYTTVAIATLCYYMQPVFLIISSPIIFKEKLSSKKIVCVIAALIGMAFVSGVFKSGSEDFSLKGIALGVGAALLYSVVVITAKKFKNIESTNSTMMQLFFAGVVMIPYCLLTVQNGSFTCTAFGLMMLLCVCIVHTGICYVMYFGSVYNLPAQTVAIFGYIDPIVSIVLSAVLLKEPFDLSTFTGAVLILGSTMISELNFGQESKNE